MSVTQDDIATIPTQAEPVTHPPAVAHRDLRWIALAVLAISQLMIVLDATIVNVALNDMQTDLGFSSANLQWVVNAYTLAFGGFLLLGGRLADRLGRRRMFMVGASLFALASLAGGFAQSQGELIGARALQGLGGAIMAPAALSLLTVVFAEGKDRDRALGLWAAISAGGAAIGLILGGTLTQDLSWKWVLWVNVPIAVVALFGARAFLPESKDETVQRFDVAGAVLGTGGLVTLVYALVRASDAGWTSAETTLTLLLAVVLLGVFGVLQSRRAHSLVPTELLRNRSVLGADLGGLIIGASMLSVFYFLSIYLGGVLGYDPVKTGLAFLPMTVMIVIGAGIASTLLGRIGPRPLLVAGTLLASGGLALLARISPDATYVGTLLPGLLVSALGMGLAFVAVTSAAIAGVPDEDSGIASALLNAGQQVGGAVGLAVLTAVSTARANAIFGTDVPGIPTASSIDATVSGWSLGFLVAAAIMLLGTVVSATMIRVNAAEAAGAAKKAVAA